MFVNAFLLSVFMEDDYYETQEEHKHLLNWVAWLYPTYIFIWMWSIYVQYYEYKKGIPHAWYCHKMFWISNFGSYAIDLAIINTKEQQEFQ